MNKSLTKPAATTKAAKRPILSMDQTPTIYIYDEIGKNDFWGPTVSATDVLNALRDIGTVPEIDVRINSPGGDVFEGDAIYNALIRNSAKINVHIDGVAASAASFIAMAGDTIAIAESAFIMIHEAWTIAMGNKGDLQQTMTLLAKVDGTMTDIYVARSGQEKAKVEEWLKAETWFTAQEALDAKLVTAIDTKFKGSDTPSDAARIAVARFSKCPAGLRQQVKTQESTASRSSTPRRDALMQRLGVK